MESPSPTVAPSPGPGEAVVPNLLGRRPYETASVLTAAGFANSMSQETCRPNEDLTLGTIITQSPVAGSVVDADTQIMLGVAIACSEVPNIVGMSKDDAIQSFAAASLTMWLRPEDCLRYGKVIEQQVAPGTVYPQVQGVIVTAECLDGQPVPPGMVVVPDVLGMPVDEARSTLDEAGIVAVMLTECANGYGYVMTQSQAGGSVVPIGSSLELTHTCL
ncbi:PASTA domain-containing protein [Parafrankia sp. EUN1f]|uniref:PASTA domain-containing protein n=1 Tax=Parafrankia sp. EUN1f TaxID=102897 RepID=UPI00055B7AC2|nr:Stk1 family PASTA domain-containing Ser/Thr kinase [Parafrankia sp. EUN1f]